MDGRLEEVFGARGGFCLNRPNRILADFRQVRAISYHLVAGEGWGTWLDIKGDQIWRMGDSGSRDLARFLLKLDNAEMKSKSQGLVTKLFRRPWVWWRRESLSQISPCSRANNSFHPFKLFIFMFFIVVAIVSYLKFSFRIWFYAFLSDL